MVVLKAHTRTRVRARMHSIFFLFVGDMLKICFLSAFHNFFLGV